MNIEEEREDINMNSNTAQSALKTILSRLVPARTKEIKVDISLSGELDLSLLSEEGFNLVRKIIFHPGKITEITNIPKGITKLSCPNNLLTILDGLPSQLEELHAQENHLDTFDVSQIPNIRILNLTVNNLAILTDLPNTLEELYIDNNQITQLDLEHATNLRVLHCSNNGLMVLQNKPKSLRDLVMEHNPLAAIMVNPTTNKHKSAMDDEITDQINYVEALNSYFKLKTKYEDKVKTLKKNAKKTAMGSKRELRRLIARIKPPCVNCARKVGTIWLNKERKYSARCGDAKTPCNLHIELDRGDFFALDDLIQVYNQEIERYKQSIIHQKMDTVFSYISEDKSLETFKTKIDEYTAYNTVYKTLIEQYDDTHNNLYRKEQLRRKTTQIYDIQDKITTMMSEYEHTGNKQVLEFAMKTYKDELLPEMNNVRQLRYDVNEIVSEKTKKDFNENLIQKENALLKMEYSHGNTPKVIRFSIKE